MRTALVFASIFVLLTTGGDAAEKDKKAKSKKQPTTSHHEHVQVLIRMDRNGDGVLHPKEVPDAARDFVKSIAEDTGLDHKNPIKLKELSVAHRKHQDKRHARDRHKQWHSEHIMVIRRMDRNRNGKLDKSEIPEGSEAFVKSVIREAGIDFATSISLRELYRAHMKRLSKLPLNHHDGSATTPDTKVTPEDSKKHAESLIHLYDEDKNGHLERGEWARLHRDWSAADRDNDGKISHAEMAKELHSLSRDGGK